MTTSVESRITQLARRDRALAITFTLLMWVVLVFLFVSASEVAPSGAIVAVLALATVLLGAFNTASLLALLRRYALNRDLIYRPDVVHSDLASADRAGEQR